MAASDLPPEDSRSFSPSVQCVADPQHAPEELAGAAENVPASVLPPDAEIDGVWEQEWRENIFRAALARVRQRANPKQYQVFDCCVLQNQRPAEVARMLGLNAAQVYLAKHRLSAAVKHAVRELEAEIGGGPGGGLTEL